MLNKKLIVMFLSIALMFGATACGGETSEKPSSEAIATVNGQEILPEELETQIEQMKMTYQQQGMEIDEEMEEQMKEQALDQLVSTTVISQAAKEEGFAPSEEEIQTQIDQIKEQYESEEKFTKVLEENNLTMEDLKEVITNQSAVTNYIEETIETPDVSDNEIAARYEQYQEQMDELPEFEEIEMQLEQEIRNEKKQQMISELTTKLKNESDINILN